MQNKMQPIWMRPPSKVTAEQYEDFYRTTFKAFDKPLTISHFSLEGQVEFRALLYVPGQVSSCVSCAYVCTYSSLYACGCERACAPLPTPPALCLCTLALRACLRCCLSASVGACLPRRGGSGGSVVGSSSSGRPSAVVIWMRVRGRFLC